MKTIVGFEGLASFPMRFIGRGIFDKLEEKYPGQFRFERYAWSETPPIKSADMRLIICHSFGVRGAIDLAKRCKSAGMDNFHLMLLDPRMPPCATSPDAPKNVDTVSFYRTGLMSGRVCGGATNYKLPSSVGHTEVPFHSDVFAMVEKLLGLEEK